MIRTCCQILSVLLVLAYTAGCAESNHESDHAEDQAHNQEEIHHDAHEAHTRIAPEMAQRFELETEIAGSATLMETATVYGQVLPNQEHVRVIRARFEGTVQSVEVSVGDRVKQGQPLAQIESNESLQPYTIAAPISGIVTQRNANPGEQSAGRALFTIIDSASVWVDLAVFPADRSLIEIGTKVRVTDAGGKVSRPGKITHISPIAEPDQSVLARVVLDNSDDAFVAGVFVKGELQIAEHSVPLAIKRTALQTMRDAPVVFVRTGDNYEMRELKLGRQDNNWVEVLGGLEPGTRYVTANSYLVKADIEKAGAAHEH